MNPKTNILDIQNMMPADFRDLDRETTCVVIPFAPIEYHGDHLPLGTDFINAGKSFRDGCIKFSEQHSGFTFLFTPVVPMGSDAVPHNGSLWVSASTVRKTSEELALRFIEYGFKNIAIFSGHGGLSHMVALESTARSLMRKHSRKKVKIFVPILYIMTRIFKQDFIDRLNTRLPDSEKLYEDDIRQLAYEGHGGRLETSYILHAAPDLMNDNFRTAESHDPDAGPVADILLKLLKLLPGNMGKELEIGARSLAVAMAWLSGGAKNGYMGFPSRASKEFGVALDDAVCSLYSDLLQEVLINNRIPAEGTELFTVLKIFMK